MITTRRVLLASLIGGAAALVAADAASADVDTEAGTTFGRNGSGWDLAQGDLGEAVSRHNLRQTEYREWLATVDQLRREADLRRRLRAIAGQQTTTIRIVAGGNSITVGMPVAIGAGQPLAMPGGYRGWLVDLLDRRDYTAQITTCAEPGRTLDQLAAALPGVVAATQPHVTLIHMGTTTPVDELPTYQARYTTMLDAVLASAPTGRVLCAQVQYSWPSGATAAATQANERSANTAITAAVAARQSTGRVALADMTPLPQEWTWDGVHPVDAGCLWMAQIWEAGMAERGWLP